MAQEEALYEAGLYAAAREDIHTFAELVMRDERTGKPIRQAPLHDDWHHTISTNQRVVIWSSVESGKALVLRTPIPTPEGWRMMGHLAVGDRVFDSRGMPCKVTFTTEVQYGRRLYRVAFDDGSEVLADADHQWIVRTNFDKPGRAPRVATTHQLLSRGVRALVSSKRKDGTRYHTYLWRVPLAGAVEYPDATLPLHPYVLGAWLGDGDSQGPTISCAPADRFVLDRCMALEGCTTKPRLSKGLLRGYLGYEGRKKDGRSVRARLAKLGVLGRKGCKFVPREYLQASVSQRRELLAGLLDTDGFTSDSGHVEYCSTVYRLANDVLELARSLGFKATLRSSPSKLYGRVVGTRHRVAFTANVPVFALPRKLARQRIGKPFGRATYKCITAIEEVPSEPVRCIAVDSPDRSYLCDRAYTVTHNTQNVSICRTLWELGRNPNLTVAILSDTAGQAEKTIRAIMGYIEHSEELHKVFPDLLPGSPWGTGGISVKRSVYAKDPSVQAVGVRGNITGSRLGLLIIDDVLDYENCRTATRRQDLYEWYLSVMPGRLYEGSRVICVGTAYHPDDLMHRFARDGWTNKRYPVVDAVTGLSRWPEQWSQARIKAKAEELGSLEFARQMLCVARDDASARFKREWVQRALYAGMGRAPAMKIEKLPSGFKTYTGVDPAIEPDEKHDVTAITTILVEPSGRRHLLEVLAGNWAGPDIVGRIEDAHNRFGSIVMVETNQAQKYLVQFLRARSGITVRAFNTGKNKYNPNFGVESLAVEMEGGQWVIPSPDGERAATSQMEALVQEMLYYDPMAHTGDRLMSLWLAREGARLGMGAFQGSAGYLGLSDR